MGGRLSRECTERVGSKGDERPGTRLREEILHKVQGGRDVVACEDKAEGARSRGELKERARAGERAKQSRETGQRARSGGVRMRTSGGTERIEKMRVGRRKVELELDRLRTGEEGGGQRGERGESVIHERNAEAEMTARRAQAGD